MKTLALESNLISLTMLITKFGAIPLKDVGGDSFQAKINEPEPIF